MKFTRRGAEFWFEELLAGWKAIWVCRYCKTEPEKLPCKNCGADEGTVGVFVKGPPIETV